MLHYHMKKTHIRPVLPLVPLKQWLKQTNGSKKQCAQTTSHNFNTLYLCVQFILHLITSNCKAYSFKWYWDYYQKLPFKQKIFMILKSLKIKLCNKEKNACIFKLMQQQGCYRIFMNDCPDFSIKYSVFPLTSAATTIYIFRWPQPRQLYIFSADLSLDNYIYFTWLSLKT